MSLRSRTQAKVTGPFAFLSPNPLAVAEMILQIELAPVRFGLFQAYRRRFFVDDGKGQQATLPGGRIFVEC
jgi:hypothetical protein